MVIFDLSSIIEILNKRTFSLLLNILCKENNMYKIIIENKFTVWLESYKLFDIENRQQEHPLILKARLHLLDPYTSW